MQQLQGLYLTALLSMKQMWCNDLHEAILISCAISNLFLHFYAYRRNNAVLTLYTCLFLITDLAYISRIS